MKRQTPVNELTISVTSLPSVVAPEIAGPAYFTAHSTASPLVPGIVLVGHQRSTLIGRQRAEITGLVLLASTGPTVTFNPLCNKYEGEPPRTSQISAVYTCGCVTQHTDEQYIKCQYRKCTFFSCACHRVCSATSCVTCVL